MHLHAPGTALENQFSNWENYLTTLEQAEPPVKALGVTDYLSTIGYESARKHQSSGRLANVMLFPNLEFRISPPTKKAGAINIHLLVDPTADDHVARVKEALAGLSYVFGDETIRCTPDGLTRLGLHLKPNLRGNQDAAYREGVGQFKPSFETFRDWRNGDRWLRRNTLVALASHTSDGGAGIRNVSGWDAVHDELHRYADIILSGNPKDREYWLGAGTDNEAELVRRFGGPKPCLHGCDAHRDEKILAPDLDRYCWIKAEPTFEGLKQALYEPQERVCIGANPPARHNPDAVIHSVRLTNTKKWFADTDLRLNPGLIAIIGEKGSGKTALTDCIAHAAGELLDSKDSFLARAGDHLSGAHINLRWASGREERGVVGTPSDESEPDITYLPQKFVERLTAGDDQGERLRTEVERVVFNYLPAHDQQGATSLQELRDSLTEGIQRRRVELSSEITKLSAQIAQLDAEWHDLPKKQGLEASQRRQLERLVQQAPKLDVAKAAEGVKALEAARAQRQTQLSTIEDSQTLLKALDAVKGEVEAFEIRMEAFWEELEPKLEALQIAPLDRAAFRPRFIGDTTTPLTCRKNTLERDLRLLRGSDAPPSQGQTSLAAIDKRIGLLEGQLTVDQQTRKRVLGHQKEVARRTTELRKLSTQISNIEKDNRTRRNDLVSRRLNHYLRAFDLLNEETQVLQRLYEPLASDLQTSALTHEVRLRFDVRRRIEKELWVQKGESLFDLRRASPVRERGEILRWTEELLKPAWLSADRDRLSEGIRQFLKRLAGTHDVRRDLRTGVKPRDVADWLFSLEHVHLGYGLTYDGTELADLSPGTRGIVLLILYLGLDRAGSGPLVIDQPDENLDNQSVYDILVPYFREARHRRQVVIITHNPNLVVNTDADQVIIATARREPNGLPAISYESGALETPARTGATSIRETVCDILEGGNEAFRRRERKYAFADRPPPQ